MRRFSDRLGLPAMNTTSVKDDIHRTCEALFEPGQVAELRILGVDGRRTRTDAGWFDDWDALAAAALRYESRTRPDGLPNRLAENHGIYVTLNPLHEACLARGANKVIEWASQTTSDRDVLRRRWLPIDLDPVRPAGVSSSDAELDLARAKADEIAAWFKEQHGAEPDVMAGSGNGVHLLFEINLPNNEHSYKVIADVLKALDDKFSDDRVHVDTALSNAARLIRLYGTLTRKGESTADRPHRRSVILQKRVR